MNVLSLFDGMSCGQIALEKAGINVNKYYASEIDKHAIQVVMKNYPRTIQLGNIEELNIDTLPKIDLILAGSPCQSFSRSGDNTGFKGKSGLFWEFIKILKNIKTLNPNVKFLLENVKMKKEWERIITNEVGISPIEIDSKLVSAQKRQRLYWTNIPNVTQPLDKDIKIKDILDLKEPTYVDHSLLMWKEDGEYRVKNATKLGYLVPNEYDVVNLDFPKSKTRRGRVSRQKANTLNTACNQAIFIKGNLKKLSPLECERLQTVPDNYTAVVSDRQRYKMLGNGWTVDVVAHILQGMEKIPKDLRESRGI